MTCHFQVKLIAFIMYLFCIFILLIGNTGNSECNYENENRFELVFRKSEKYVLGLRKTADVDVFSEADVFSGCVRPQRLSLALISGLSETLLPVFLFM